ncbi:hypothetical protein ACFLWR_04065 [Chloroflexota bacterium]
MGPGPFGLLANALIRLAKANTYVVDIVSEDSPKAHLVKHMGASYIDARDKTPQEIMEICCPGNGDLHLILEASGAAETAVRFIPYMSRSSIYVMIGIPGCGLNIELDTAQLIRQIVRYNQVVVGGVNSNRRHFEMALKDKEEINSGFNGLLIEMMTHRFKINNYQQAFGLNDSGHIKTIIEIEPWY